MKYHTVVYGCQMNISDAERTTAVLEGLKYKRTPNMNEADLILVVMCSVRQSAVDRIHGLVQKFKKARTANRNLTTILTGCIPKKDKKKFLDGFDYVVDIKEIGKLHKILGASHDYNNDYNNDQNYLDIKPKYSSKFFANVPIMTGCNNFCSYCVVPYARRHEVSRPAKGIISEVESLIKNGYKEIWLLGQNVNSYKDPASAKASAGEVINFPKLLKMVNDIPGNFWIRFTSSHPKDFNKEVIDTLAMGGKITPYLNLPIQSGDDKILKLMSRHYTVKEYKNKIKELRKKIPDVCLSTDVIVGFPGETKKQFENTAKLFRNVKYDMAYINKYSERAGTAAAKLKDNVPIAEKKKRERILTEILKQTALEKNKKYIGKIVEILVDGEGSGRTKEYKNVTFKAKKNLQGRFIKAKIIKVTPWHLEGKLL